MVNIPFEIPDKVFGYTIPKDMQTPLILQAQETKEFIEKGLCFAVLPMSEEEEEGRNEGDNDASTRSVTTDGTRSIVASVEEREVIARPSTQNNVNDMDVEEMARSLKAQAQAAEQENKKLKEDYEVLFHTHVEDSAMIQQLEKKNAKLDKVNAARKMLNQEQRKEIERKETEVLVLKHQAIKQEQAHKEQVAKLLAQIRDMESHIFMLQGNVIDLTHERNETQNEIDSLMDRQRNVHNALDGGFFDWEAAAEQAEVSERHNNNNGTSNDTVTTMPEAEAIIIDVEALAESAPIVQPMTAEKKDGEECINRKDPPPQQQMETSEVVTEEGLPDPEEVKPKEETESSKVVGEDAQGQEPPTQEPSKPQPKTNNNDDGILDAVFGWTLSSE